MNKLIAIPTCLFSIMLLSMPIAQAKPQISISIGDSRDGRHGGHGYHHRDRDRGFRHHGRDRDYKKRHHRRHDNRGVSFHFSTRPNRECKVYYRQRVHYGFVKKNRCHFKFRGDWYKFRKFRHVN